MQRHRDLDTKNRGPLTPALLRRRALPLLAIGALAVCAPLAAQRNLKTIPDPDVSEELASFTVADGFEVDVFAADPLVSKPIQMNFDARGRLWVVSSPLYPHIKPGEQPEDRVLILTDEDGDGRADHSIVFAEDLLMPTGLEPGDGGVYVANSTEVLFLKDTDGDDRADYRRVVLSGFGTEDTHHLIHTFRWGHDGCLYFNQSIYIHSHVETPWGVRRMNGGGVWRFRPETMRLEPFVYGMCNGWGHHFDRWGQSIGADGAGFDGVHYLLPGSTLPHSPRPDPVLRGLNPGAPKYCGGEIVSGRHLPEDWRGSFVTNDFRAHRVVRYVLSDDGAGYSAKQMPDVLRSSHVAFRPIDVKMGPDGAIYIADWYNPIIQHGEVSFRDPRRNHTNGRIWRLTAKGRPLVERPELVGRPIPELLDRLRAPEGWTRHFARRVLAERPRDEVLAATRRWLDALDAGDPTSEAHALEGLWVLQSLRAPSVDVLDRLLAAQEPRVRTAAVRVLVDWRDDVPGVAGRLAKAITDPYARARLEAVRGLAEIDQPASVELAVAALDQPMDPFLDYALKLTIRQLREAWVPALERGEIDFGGNARHLEYALAAVGSPEVVGRVVALYDAGKIPAARQPAILEIIAELGRPEHLGRVLSWARANAAARPAEASRLLEALADSASRDGRAPTAERTSLAGLLRAAQPSVQVAASRLAGAWKEEALRESLEGLALDSKAALDARGAALRALASLDVSKSGPLLERVARSGEPASPAALAALVSANTAGAAQLAAELLGTLEPEGVATVVDAFLGRQGGATALAEALEGRELSTDAARVVLRRARASGRAQDELIAAAQRAAGIDDAPRVLSPAQKEALLARVGDHGSAARGEAIFRRSDLRCLECHAIGGAGGRVGPDLTSIGGSAQLDYLLDSLFEPNKAVKENYNGVVVVTRAGAVLTGVQVRRSDEELVLRDAEDRELRLATSEILQTSDGKSIMPTGLVDSLTDEELVDLLAFLSSLGRDRRFSVGPEPIARTWRALDEVPSALARLEPDALGRALDVATTLPWTPLYARVDGSLPLDRAGEVESRRVLYLRAEVDVTSPGAVGFALPAGARAAWIDGEPIDVDAATSTLAEGRHRLLLEVESSSASAEGRVRLVEVPRSTARAQWVVGK